MKRLLMGLLILLLLIGICASLERSVSPDGTATQTETILTEAGNEFSDILQGIADGFKSIFFASEDDSTNSEIGEISVEDLPDDVRDIYKKYEKAGWQGNVSGQTSKTRAGGIWDNAERKLPELAEDSTNITYKEFDVDNVEEDGQRRQENDY